MVLVQGYILSELCDEKYDSTYQSREAEHTNLHYNHDEEVGWFPSLCMLRVLRFLANLANNCEIFVSDFCSLLVF